VELEEVLSEMEASAREQDALVENLEGERNLAQERAAKLEGVLDGRQSELDHIRERAAEMQNSFESQLMQVSGQVRAAQDALQAARSGQAEAQDAHQFLQAETQALREEKLVLEAAYQKAERDAERAGGLEDQIDSFSDDLKALRGQIVDLRYKLDAEEMRRVEAQDEVLILEKKLEQQEAQEAVVPEELLELQEEKQSLNLKVSQLESRLEKVQAELEKEQVVARRLRHFVNQDSEIKQALETRILELEDQLQVLQGE
jgi:chromosome segregation ATPase